MLTHKQNARLRAYIRTLKSKGKYTDDDIADLVKKKAEDFNPATPADVDKLIADVGLPSSDGRKDYAVDD